MKQKNLKKILECFDREYGTDTYCFLEYKNAFELLIATILSAQCTDKRVNTVTKRLFAKYPDAKALAKADISDVEKEIHELGFYRAKAANITKCAKMLADEYGGRVPDCMDELVKLPGVGRKTANVILGNVYKIPSIVVDTHVKRISKKLGLTDETEPEKIEYELQKVLPKDHWILWNIHVITLGRTICTARNPKCSECFLRDFCISRSV